MLEVGFINRNLDYVLTKNSCSRKEGACDNSRPRSDRGTKEMSVFSSLTHLKWQTMF